jgi:hypothetical protein
VDADGALLLLREILADIPRLPGASCTGKHALFDPVLGNGHRYQRRQEQIRLAEAARVCAGCPVIEQCTTVEGLCCIGGKQTSFPLCCLDQMARASSVKIAVSRYRRSVSKPSS